MGRDRTAPWIDDRMRCRRTRHAQRGVAIISVLLTVALAMFIVSGLFLREHVTVRSVENRVALSQTRWVERAAIDWSKVILAADSGNGTDHLGEPWAVPVAETRLDETVTAGARIDDESRAATLTGQIFDAQARFNLNSLIKPNPELPGRWMRDETRVGAFQRLLGFLDRPDSLADTLMQRLLAAKPVIADDGSLRPGALPLQRVTDLLAVRGFDLETVEALEPFVVFLPDDANAINANTAPAEVIAAFVPGMDVSQARQLVSNRERVFFQTRDQFVEALVPKPENLDPTLFSVQSGYFLVRGLIRFGRVESFTETLLERKAQRVTVIWQRRL